MPVTFTDKGLTDIKSQMTQLRRWTLTIGYQGKDGNQEYPEGINVATVALYNEFGTRDIPARSWIRSTLFINREAIANKIADAVGAVVVGKLDSLGALQAVGKFVVKLIRTRVNTSTHWAKPNAPSTIRKKGFDRPLHERFDHLAKRLSWAIRDGGVNGSIVIQGKQ